MNAYENNIAKSRLKSFKMWKSSDTKANLIFSFFLYHFSCKVHNELSERIGLNCIQGIVPLVNQRSLAIFRISDLTTTN